MAVYDVYTQCVCYKYRSTFCSKSTIFLLVITFLTIFVPLLIAYRSHGFWLKSASYREQPHIHFKHDYILLLETNQPDSPIMCSSLPNFNEIAMDYNYCFMVKTREEDNNSDGVLDELYFEINAVIPPTLSVYSLQLFMIFDYKLLKQCLMEMESIAFIQYSSSLPGASVDIMGDLRLIQKEPLHSRGRDIRYNNSIFYGQHFSPDVYNSVEIIKQYGKRNLSTQLQNVNIVWTRGPVTDENFLVSVNIQYPEETIIYRPGFWQVMKWAWIQYLSILIIFIVLFRYIKCYVFRNRLIPAVQEIPWKKMF